MLRCLSRLSKKKKSLNTWKNKGNKWRFVYCSRPTFGCRVKGFRLLSTLTFCRLHPNLMINGLQVPTSRLNSYFLLQARHLDTLSQPMSQKQLNRDDDFFEHRLGDWEDWAHQLWLAPSLGLAYGIGICTDIPRSL